MKHLKKALCLVLALALCVGLFSACGGDGGSSSEAPEHFLDVTLCSKQSM